MKFAAARRSVNFYVRARERAFSGFPRGLFLSPVRISVYLYKSRRDRRRGARIRLYRSADGETFLLLRCIRRHLYLLAACCTQRYTTSATRVQHETPRALKQSTPKYSRNYCGTKSFKRSISSVRRAIIPALFIASASCRCSLEPTTVIYVKLQLCSRLTSKLYRSL